MHDNKTNDKRFYLHNSKYYTMKKLLFITAISISAFTVHAQDNDSIRLLKENEIRYCVNYANEIRSVTHDGKILSGPVTLMSGATLDANGIVIWNDKSRTKLKDGYCIDESGSVFPPAAATAKLKAKAIAADQKGK